MFLQRFISAIILIPLVLAGIFYAPAWFLSLILMLIILALGYEYWFLIPLHKSSARGLLLIALLLGVALFHYAYGLWLAVGLVFWFFLAYAILTYPRSEQYWGSPPAVLFIAWFTLALFGQSAIHLYNHPQGISLLVYLLFLIWSFDTGAYLAGKRFGVHKLIPQVSPGKSWEGLLGGFFFSLLVAIIGYHLVHSQTSYYWFFVSLITAILSLFGDLLISMLKRRCHLKDTGSLIPGHGGLLDRLDSLILAIPVFYFLLNWS